MPPEPLQSAIPSLGDIGFADIDAATLPFPAGMSGAARQFETFTAYLANYDKTRDFPARDATSHLSVHLRFGTASIRSLARHATDAIRLGEGGSGAAVWLSELIWRDFYFMILHHHPRVVECSFKPAFDAIAWKNGQT